MTRRFIKKYEKIIRDVAYTDLSKKEIKQLLKYLWIYLIEEYEEHWEVNQHITDEEMWDEFEELRSLNDHGYRNKIRGIAPRYFAIVCSALEITAGDGEPLIDYERY